MGQALLVLGGMAALELWGGVDGRHAALIRELEATPVSARRLVQVVRGGLDVVYDSINAIRLPDAGWFIEDLKRVLALLANGAIRPRVTERIPLDKVAEAHRQLEVGGLEGKLVLRPGLA